MKNIVTLCLLIAVLSSCEQKKSKTNLHLSGNIKGLQKGILYIKKIVDTTLVTIDTIKIDGKNSFETDLNITSPEMYYLSLDRGITNSKDNNLSFFAEAGKMNISTSLDKFSYDAKITGSKNNDLYNEYKKVVSKFNDENLDLTVAKFHAVRFKHPTTADSLQGKQNSNTIRRYLYTVNFALNNRNYEVSPFVALTEIYDVNLKYMDTIQKSMSPKVSQSLYGKKLTKLLIERKQNETK